MKKRGSQDEKEKEIIIPLQRLRIGSAHNGYFLIFSYLCKKDFFGGFASGT